MKQTSQTLLREIEECLERLFPITRSITGPGNRETLEILQDIVPIEIKEYPSGLEVYDWKIPDEWRVKDAWIKNSRGEKIVDFQQSNIHLVSYSEPINKKVTFNELKEHLHTHPTLKSAIPYRTSYYERTWGFCVTHDQYELLSMESEFLEVCVDSSFHPDGSLTIGELCIPGKGEEEVLISTYICHPSLANDNLSGATMTAFLAREILRQQQNHDVGYRIIWVPETIGSIAYCAMNEESMKNIDLGLVVTTVGGNGKFGYKQSFNEDHGINAVIENVFNKNNLDFITYPFDIRGSDERQYSSPGFRINMASITKDKYYEYPYYHTSLDNLDFVKSSHIIKSLNLYLQVLKSLSLVETNGKSCELVEPKAGVYTRVQPCCEVMLSKHGLYPKIGGGQLPEFGAYTELDIILWLLFWCDGQYSLKDISEILHIEEGRLEEVAEQLVQKGVLKFE